MQKSILSVFKIVFFALVMTKVCFRIFAMKNFVSSCLLGAMEMNDYYKNLPKKRIGVGALIFNDKGELLILKPGYKDYWTIPGGAIEENESPRQGCIREIKEEIGIDIVELKFLCVDYKTARDDQDECLQFIFWGGKLQPEQNIRIDGKEIIDYKFSDITEAAELLGGLKRGLVKRLPQCLDALKNGIAIYLENGDFSYTNK